MKHRVCSRKTAIALLGASSVLLLQACGGGSDGAPAYIGPVAAIDTPAQPGAAPTDSGSVSAPFVAGATPRYQLVGTGLQTFGRLDTFTQEPSGAVTAINDRVLSGQLSVRDVAGDASFALGRWVAGTLTTASGAETLTGNGGYHYMVYNALAAFPSSGSFACDAGTFSTPTRDTGPAIAPLTGSASGQASLVFDDGGAHATGAITVSANGSSTASLDASPASPTSTAITGRYLANGAGAAVQVADAGAGAYQLVGSYRALLADGASYIGVYRFVCR